VNTLTARQPRRWRRSGTLLVESSPHVSMGLAAAAVVLLGMLASQWGVLELQVHSVEQGATTDAAGEAITQPALGCGRVALRIADHVIRQAPCPGGAPAQPASAGLH